MKTLSLFLVFTVLIGGYHFTGLDGTHPGAREKNKTTPKSDKTIIFIHGMFQNAKSWEQWTSYFQAKGYTCIAESWPLHQGNPKTLRAKVPPSLGDLGLQEIYDKYAALVKQHPDAILIGHSVGGLLVQKLINNGLGSKGICISSVAPNKMLSVDWDFFRNSVQITNPVKGDKPFEMTADDFYKNFGNAMPRAESDKAYERTATYDSRNVLRDCLLKEGEIKLDNTSRPLLFIGGEKDQIIPAKLNEKNAKAYNDGIAEYKEFSNRGHFICGQPGWEEVAAYSLSWIEKH